MAKTNEKIYLAADLGAGSGRVMAAKFDGKKLELEEVSRWASEPVKKDGAYHWNVGGIFDSIKDGVKKARSMYGDAIVSLGIDSWAVDYGLLDANDNLINDPFIYRDVRTNGMMEHVFKRVSKERIYGRTGIQFLFFNTLYQMAAETRRADSALERAKTFLMMPDLLSFMFTGIKRNERTNASSTQFYDPFNRDWAFDLLDAIGVPRGIFENGFAEAGESLGRVRTSLEGELGKLKIATVASHDTASAVAAVPSTEANPAYLNSGTWSLPGLELDKPLATPETLNHNFTNEVGAEGKIRFLKNVTGMWLVQKSKEVWKKNGTDMSYAELEAESKKCEPFAALFDPDSPDFTMPSDMPAAIAANCSERKTKKIPVSHGEIFRAIQESAALKYAYVFDTLEKLTGVKIDKINVMGGGSRDNMLNQFTANATGKVVCAGPVESTALGNAIMQMKAAGDIKSLAEGRAIVAASCSPKVFEPKDTALWRDAYSFCEELFAPNRV